MGTVRILEVVQGLGRGGAERSLIQRLRFAPPWVHTTILNLRPTIDALRLPENAEALSFRGGPLRARSEIKRVINSFDFDIIVARTPMDLILLASIPRAQRAQAKIMYEAHSEVLSPRSRLVSFLMAPVMRFASGSADVHLAVSEQVARGQQCAGARKVLVHHLGADVDVEAVPQLDRVTGTRVLYLGRLSAEKRPIWILEAIRDCAESFRQSGSVFTMVGHGPMATAVNEFIHSAGIADIVEVIGPVEDPDPYLAASDVLVIGSLREGLPLVIFEAKRMGLRIVSTPAGGCSEVLGETDVVVADFSKSSFIEAIKGQLAKGPQRVGERRRLQQLGAVWSPAISAQRFYENAHELVEEIRVVEVLTGPIEGGIPTTLRARLHFAPAHLRTTLICPHTNWHEAKAPPSSFPCEVILCSPGWKGLRQIAEVLQRDRPRALIAHTERDLWWSIFARAFSRVRVPISYVIHNDQFDSRSFIKPFVPVALRAARPFVDSVVAVTPDTRAGDMGRNFPKVRIANQPSLARPKASIDALSSDPVFVAAKRLVPSKGIDVMLAGAAHAQERLRASSARIVIAGSGPMYNSIVGFIEAQGIADIVEMRGWVSDINDLLNEGHYFLQPSLHEGAGMSLVEALCTGMRVASSPLGLARDALANDEQSTLFSRIPDASDWELWFKDAAQRPLPNVDERRERRRRAQARFDPQRLTMEFYEMILNSEPVGDKDPS